MKLHPDQNSALNTVTAYGSGFFEINRVRHEGAILLMPEGEVRHWEVDSYEALSAPRSSCSAPVPGTSCLIPG